MVGVCARGGVFGETASLPLLPVLMMTLFPFAVQELFSQFSDLYQRELNHIYL